MGNVLTWRDLEGMRREEWGEYNQNPLYVCMKFSKKKIVCLFERKEKEDKEAGKQKLW